MDDRFANHPAGFGVVSAREATAMTGLDFLRAMMEGRYPGAPFARTARMIPTIVDEGRVVFEGDPTEDFLNPLGTVHGGWTSTILDSVMACAVHSTLAAGEAYTTLEFKVSFFRPVMPGSGPVRAEGTLISKARRVATSEGKLFDKAGRLLAHGTETSLVFDVPQSVRS